MKRPDPLAGESGIVNDRRQLGIPGTERSAVQAQAARDAEGRGAILARSPQQPCNHGLFAYRPDQPELF